MVMVAAVKLDTIPKMDPFGSCTRRMDRGAVSGLPAEGRMVVAESGALDRLAPNAIRTTDRFE